MANNPWKFHYHKSFVGHLTSLGYILSNISLINNHVQSVPSCHSENMHMPAIEGFWKDSFLYLDHKPFAIESSSSVDLSLFSLS